MSDVVSVEKGYAIVIPEKFKEKLGIKEGDFLEISEEEGRMVLERIDPDINSDPSRKIEWILRKSPMESSYDEAAETLLAEAISRYFQKVSIVSVEKGYAIVIPEKFREKLGIKEGDFLEISEEEGRIILKRINSDPFKTLERIVGEPYGEEVDEEIAERWLLNAGARHRGHIRAASDVRGRSEDPQDEGIEGS